MSMANYLIISSILPILISLLLVIPTAFSQFFESPLLNKVCKTTFQNYTQNSTNFANNLNNLLDDLVERTPKNDLFLNATSGQGPDNIAFGLALCRGDVSPDQCRFCLEDARCKITQRCYKKSAIVWYDYCQLKYSDVNFFGQIDNENVTISTNKRNVSDKDTAEFKRVTLELLGKLTIEATINTTDKYMFGKGKTSFGNKTKIHGMALCTGDLSHVSCKKCLDDAMEKLPIYSVGGRVFGGSCTVPVLTNIMINSPRP